MEEPGHSVIQSFTFFARGFRETYECPLSLVAIAFLLFAGCDGGGKGGAREQPRLWEPVPAGVVLTRNLMVPPAPADAGYRILPGRYRLGTAAYAKPRRSGGWRSSGAPG